MRRVLIANLFNYSGGGVRVTLSIAQVLAEEGFDVTLFALRGFDVDTLDRIHGTKLSMFIGRNLRIIYSNVTSGLKPAFIYHSVFTRYLREQIDRLRPELVIVFDDVPKFLAEERYKDLKVMLYSHLPLYFHKEVLHINSIPYKLIDHIYHVYGSRYYYVGRALDNWLIVANSSITAAVLHKLLNRVDAVIYPPVVKPSHISYKEDEKRRIIASIGVMEPSKRFEVIIRSLKMVKDGHLIIIGHTINKKYLKRLIKEIKNLKLEDRVKLFLDISDKLKWHLLTQAKIIAHAKIFEPFGIAVAEGMSVGAVPVVYKGFLSGPWIDIVDKGKYGLGFKDEIELSEIIENILNDHDSWREFSEKALYRSRDFSLHIFKLRLISLLKRLGL